MFIYLGIPKESMKDEFQISICTCMYIYIFNTEERAVEKENKGLLYLVII